MSKILVLDRSEDLAEQVRAAMEDTDVEIVSCTKIGSTSHIQAEHEGPFQVIVAGPSLGTRAGIKRLATLHRELPSAEIVMAFSARPDASLREIVQAGASDLVELPTEDAVIRAALKRALELAERGRKPAAAVLAQQAAAAPAIAPKQGRVFTVCSATGGCGKTFYAANLALLLARVPNAKVCIIDLDLQFGELSTALRLQPPYTIVDALRSSGDDEDDAAALGQHLDECLVEYDGKFWALAAPKDPAQADEISPVEVTKVIEALRARFDYVVVDTPTALAETVLAAFDLSEHLFVMATLDLPSVRNLGMFLQTLTKLRIDTENVSLILNKVERDVGIEPGQIVKMFPQGFRSTIPYAKEVSKSINLGKPVVASFPDSEVSRKVTAGLREFVPDHANSSAIVLTDTRPAPHGIGRLFRRVGAR
jgi:pilus assembly protein CpaE